MKFKLNPISFWEWLVCSLGMFLFGFGLGYSSLEPQVGFWLAFLGIILEIPAFYLIYKHKS